jgi:hypothetical protein
MSESTKLFLEIVLPAIGASLAPAFVLWLTRLTTTSRELVEIKNDLKHLLEASKQTLTEDRARLVMTSVVDKSLETHFGQCREIVIRPLNSRVKNIDDRVRDLEAA